MLATKFEKKKKKKKNLGWLKYFLGTKITKLKDAIFLSQQKYVLDLSLEIRLLQCISTNTQTVQNHNL